MQQRSTRRPSWSAPQSWSSKTLFRRGLTQTRSAPSYDPTLDAAAASFADAAAADRAHAAPLSSFTISSALIPHFAYSKQGYLPPGPARRGLRHDCAGASSARCARASSPMRPLLADEDWWTRRCQSRCRKEAEEEDVSAHHLRALLPAGHLPHLASSHLHAVGLREGGRRSGCRGHDGHARHLISLTLPALVGAPYQMAIVPVMSAEAGPPHWATCATSTAAPGGLSNAARDATASEASSTTLVPSTRT